MLEVGAVGVVQHLKKLRSQREVSDVGRHDASQQPPACSHRAEYRLFYTPIKSAIRFLFHLLGYELDSRLSARENLNIFQYPGK